MAQVSSTRIILVAYAAQMSLRGSTQSLRGQVERAWIIFAYAVKFRCAWIILAMLELRQVSSRAGRACYVVAF